MKRYAVIGWPLEHSMSPSIHNASFEAMGLDCRLDAVPVPPDGLGAFMRSLASSGLRGLAVTIPHKGAVLRQCASADPAAAAIGAANTVSVGGGGETRAYNTDASGAAAALRDAGISAAGARVVVLGAGGAARAICHRLLSDGAASVAIANRTVPRAEALRDDLERACGAAGRVEAVPASGPGFEAALASAGILINATPVGMSPRAGESPVPRGLLRRGLAVMDIVYNPLETRLLADARAAGAVAIPGTEMLLRQAEGQERIWLGVEAPLGVMRAALLSALARSP